MRFRYCMGPSLLALVAVVALMAEPAVASEPAPSVDAGRFRVSAEIRPQARSDDGRFALTAKVRVVPEATSLDGRFALKSINVPDVGCDPFAADIFANGFEGS